MDPQSCDKRADGHVAKKKLSREGETLVGLSPNDQQCKEKWTASAEEFMRFFLKVAKI